MFSSLNPLIAAVSALLPGLIIGYLVRQVLSSRKASQAEAKAEAMLNEGKSKAQDILLEAKNKALAILEEGKKEEKERNSQLSRIENLLTKKENELEIRAKELKTEKETLLSKAQEVANLKVELDKNRQKQIVELERVASLSREQAKTELFNKVEEEAKDELYKRMLKLEHEKKEELDKRAKEILTLAVQRYAASQIADAVSTVVSLPSDELKGKIIGKEGRNIKTIERLTGVDVIIDDTPEALIISGFDPVRRQVAKLAIDKLIQDGRIHPAKSEEMVEKARNEINEKIKEAGEAALFETGIGPVDPKLVYLLGRLAFRTSFGQNVLLHSIEMTHIAGMLAAELGIYVSIAKKGAMFHDIGKAVDHEVQGTHVEIGRKILQKFGMDPKVILAMEAHHEEYPYAILESRIIQAGRELRIFVTPTKVDDLGALKMAKDIAKKVEEEMKYPGEIKVNVIRETRAIEYAR